LRDIVLYRQILGLEKPWSVSGVELNMGEQHATSRRRKIVFDRFHIVSHMGEAIDMVRLQEHRALLATGDATLKGTRHFWLYKEKNIPEPKCSPFDRLRGLHINVGRDRANGDRMRCLWTYLREGQTRCFFKRWFFCAPHSRLKPVARVAQMLRLHVGDEHPGRRSYRLPLARGGRLGRDAARLGLSDAVHHRDAHDAAGVHRHRNDVGV